MAWSPLKLISPVAKKYMAMLHAARENSITGSQKNIQAPASTIAPLHHCTIGDHMGPLSDTECRAPSGPFSGTTWYFN